MEKYGFVYIWYDKKHKRYYIGAHWGTEDDGYICSSKWMKDSYKRRPQDFKRKILKSNIIDKKILLNEEYVWLSKIKDEELGKRYYNLHNHHFNHWSSDEDQLANIKEKRKLYVVTDETKEKLRISHLGHKQKETTKQKLREIHTGRIILKEWREKLSNSLKGKIVSDETKKRMSEARKFKKRGPYKKKVKLDLTQK